MVQEAEIFNIQNNACPSELFMHRGSRANRLTLITAPPMGYKYGGEMSILLIIPPLRYGRSLPLNNKNKKKNPWNKNKAKEEQ
jgi:hypothetical protein